METFKKYSLTFNFNNLDEMNKFINILEHKEDEEIVQPNIEQPKDEQKEKRGSKTHILHQKTREYKLEHPDINYRTCLKIVGQEIKKK